MKLPFLIGCMPIFVRGVCGGMVMTEGKTTNNEHMGHFLKQSNIKDHIKSDTIGVSHSGKPQNNKTML